MKHLVALTTALSLTALLSAPSFAADAAPKTRAQVKAELAEALRTGDIIGDGQTGQKLKEMFPGSYAGKNAK